MIFFGYFDIVVFVILIFLNVKFWRKEINTKIGCLTILISFGILLPLISQIVEIQKVKHTIGIVDNFEVLYTYLRFPTYWAFGIAQAIALGIKSKNK